MTISSKILSNTSIINLDNSSDFTSISSFVKNKKLEVREKFSSNNRFLLNIEVSFFKRKQRLNLKTNILITNYLFEIIVCLFEINSLNNKFWVISESRAFVISSRKFR